MNDELPQGWAEITLQDAGAWRSGGTPSRRRPEFFGKGIPWIKSGDLPDGPILKTEEEITKLGLENSSTKLMPTGTISIALYGATIGRLGVMTFPAATNQACANVIPDTRLVESKYLFYYLLSERQNFIEQGQGGAQPNISQEIVRSHPFRLAPLAEQQRIVAKLEVLLGQVDTCQQRLEKIPTLLKRFRQAVLAAACSGRLTEDWREENPNIESGLDMLHRVLSERQKRAAEHGMKSSKRRPVDLSEFKFETDAELPSSWAKAKLDNLIYIAGRIGWRGLKAEEYTQLGPVLLSVFNLNYGENVDFRKVNRISKERYDESPEIKLKVGDILLAKDGAGIGKIGFVAHLPEPATVNSSLLLIRALETFIPKYLFYFLSGPDLQNLAKERITGSSTPHLFQKDIREFFLSVPPLSEQQEIVRRVESLFALADNIEQRYKKAQAFIDKVTPSLLAKAFRGELVPQDPSDEPASVLLERIQ
jgi:type I restriction enzyme S subunit